MKVVRAPVLVFLLFSLLPPMPTAVAASRLPANTYQSNYPSATTATIATNRTWVMPTQAVAFEITVTDPDRNTSGSFLQVGTDADGVTMRCNVGTVVGSTCGTFRLANFPVADANGDGLINFQDVTVTGASGGGGATEQFFVDAFNGLVTLKAATQAVSGTDLTFYLSYKASVRENISTGGAPRVNA